MSLLTKQGTLAVPAVEGAFSDSTVGFQGKFGVFFYTLLKTTGFGVGRNFGYGFVDSGGNQRCIAYGAVDNVTTPTDYNRRQQASKLVDSISHNGSFGILPIDISFTSWDSNGFTLTLNDLLSGYDGVLIHYLILGGTDLTNTWVGDITTPTSTGVQSYTAPNFQPDLLLTAGFADNTTMPGSNSGIRAMLGAGTGPTAQYSVATGENSNIPTAVYSNASPKIVQIETESSTKFVANLDSMDALGWTWNWTTTNATPGSVMVAALRGGRYFVGTDTQRTSAGTKQRVGVGFTPKGGMFMGVNLVSPGTRDQTSSKLSVGATDGSTSAAVWGSGTDNVSTTDENSYVATDACLVHASNPATLDAKASLGSFDPDGYTLSYSTADANAREFLAVLAGDTAVTNAKILRPMRMI